MDPFKRLKLEYASIRKTVEGYTHGIVMTHFDGLRKAIDNNNGEEILFFLGKIVKWYQDTIDDIDQNPFMDDSDVRAHHDAKQILEELNSQLNNYDFLGINFCEPNNLKKTGAKKLFLSHRSSDKKYADALEKFITGLGVKPDQLIYTSHPLHKIPFGKKIYDYLRDNINDQVFMVMLLSNDYLESPACLCEMGAAWITQTDYYCIYTPSFSFDNNRYHEIPIDTTKMGAVLNGDRNCRMSMLELKDKIQQFFDLPDDEKVSAYLIDAFMTDIQ